MVVIFVLFFDFEYVDIVRRNIKLISEMIKINMFFLLFCYRFCLVNVELLKKLLVCEDNLLLGKLNELKNK